MRRILARRIPRRLRLLRFAILLALATLLVGAVVTVIGEALEGKEEPPASAAGIHSASPAPSLSAPAYSRSPRPPVDVYRFTRPDDMSKAVRRFPERVYVPDNETDTVTVIDPATLKIVGRFHVGAYPQHITPSWDMQHLYVENSYGSSLTVIDPKTGRPSGTIRGVPEPYNLYFTPDGTKAIDVDEYQSQVQFRDPHNWRLLGVVQVPWPGVDHGEFTANGRYLVMSTEYSGVVIKIDVVQMRMVGSVHVGGRPIDIKASPDGEVFYVANQGLDGVTLLDPTHLRVLGFIQTGVGAHGLAVSRNGKLLYVANRIEGSISVISFATRRVVAKWHVGGSPDMLQVSPDGSQLWTSNRFNGSVSVISTRTGHVITVIHTGIKPHGLTYFPQPGRYCIGHNGVYR